ncbi:MAG: AAA family ATPase [Deltaproteobacteria bacterium]|nr:MAG: AAA family ATPase [Deltaproteobacteria bacterium]
MTKVVGYKDDLEFLGAALEVIRLRGRLRILEREQAGLIPRDPVTAMSEGEVDQDAIAAELAARVTEHDKRLAKTKAAPSLLKVQETFGLDDFERDVLLLALAPAIDGSFQSLFGRVRGSSYRAPLDIDAALTLLVDDFADRVRHRQAFAPSGRLLQSNLLLVGRGAPDGGDEFLSLELRLPARLVTLLLGQPGEDETLQSFSRLVEPTETLERVILPLEDKQRIVELIALHGAYVEAMDTWGLREAVPYGRGITMLFAGPPGTGKTLTARAVANHLGRRLLLVDTSRLSGQERSFETNLENLLREARLQSAVLFFDECEGLFAAQNRLGGHLSALLQAIEHFDGICILATNLPQVLDHALDRRILYRVNFLTPTPTMREGIWAVHLPKALPIAPDVDIPYLSRRFEFTGGYIKNAVLLAAGAAAGRAATQRGTPAVTQRDLLEACYSQLRSRLHELADHDQADLRLTDLILPEEIKQQIVEIIEAVSSQSRVFREWGFGRKFNKGRGLSALFDGEPGTGKTLSAEVIAAELGLGLYRVNVANVVSKYIGETEKNLQRIFTEARGSQSVLLFDEADSLFSKRVEVKGSNDRFANMETNVLLQLIERYDGLVILTTNLKTSIDKAFERRLSFKINFPFPDWETRATIWEHLLPSEAPLAKELDFDLLGQCFELSGGSIKNAVLRTAYRAAATGSPLTMDLFEDAAKRECQAAGKLFRVARRDESW